MSSSVAIASAVEEQYSPLPSVAKRGRVEEEEEEEEETKGGGDEAEEDVEFEERRRRSDPPTKLKLKPRDTGNDLDDGSRSPLGQRSPSRLATSLFSRDGMARAARAWREGARLAGILRGEDDSDEEEKREEEDASPEDGVDAGSWRGSVAQEAPQPRVDPLIPRLALARLTPKTRVPKMSQVWMFLDRIEFISIREVFVPDEDDGTVHYILDVYHYQEQHSIPTRHHNRMRCTPPPPHRHADYRIQQRFSSFMRLRKHVRHASRCKHAAPCAYCHKLGEFVASGLSGWKAKFFTTVEMRKLLLSQFISQLVELVRERREPCPLLSCVAQSPLDRQINRTLPGIVKRFLTVQTGENYMR